VAINLKRVMSTGFALRGRIICSKSVAMLLIGIHIVPSIRTWASKTEAILNSYSQRNTLIPLPQLLNESMIK